MAEIVVSEFMDEAIATEGFAGRDLIFDPTLVDDEQRLFEALQSAKALIVRNRTQVNEALLAASPNLVVVGRLGVGLDNIDLDACAQRNVKVCPATGANDLSVAEYVITAVMALLRGAWQCSDDVSSGTWPRNAMIGREVSGKCLGLVGFGAIARETASRARALGMDVAAYDPYLAEESPLWSGVQRLGFDELLKVSDAISFHTPLTEETRHQLNAEAISNMPKGSVVVNAARGGIVDEDALVAALKAGHLAGAALDVFENEPLSAEVGEKFKGLSNVFLTPHIAGVTAESNVRVSQVTVDNVLNVLGS